jgi:phosphatidylinositol-3-phosphatase
VWGGAPGTEAATATPALLSPGLSRPCGTLTGKPVVDEVLVIWEENHSYSSIIGNPAASEFDGLAARCGLATSYEALTHPSLPNYMEMTSGHSFASWPWYNDCDPQGSCTTSAPSIFSELSARGKQWRSYAEAMGNDCGLVSYGEYAAKHNPAVYFTSIRRQCDAWDQPMGTPSIGAMHQALRSGPSAALTTVSPDLLDDMHDGTVAEAGNWLAGWLPQIVASPAYRSGHLAVFIAWDEGSGSGNVPSHVPLIVMSASTPVGARSGVRFDDYSVARTICQLTGVPDLGRAAAAAALAGPFHL